MKAAPIRPEKRRRLRDRLVDRDGTDNIRLTAQHRLTNHLMLFDDELRETALALGGIESFLARALTTLERGDLSRFHLEDLATDLDVDARLAELDDTLTSLKARLRIMADQIDSGR